MRPSLACSLFASLALAAVAGCVDPDADKGDDTDILDTDVVDTDTPDTDVADTDADTDLPAPSTLVQGGVQTCADPSAWEVSPYDMIDVNIALPPTPYANGGGSTTADLNGDGLIDIVAVTNDAALLWLQTPDQHFDRRTLLTRAHPDTDSGLFGAAAADYDGDGDLDLMITGRHVGNALLRNDGTATFEDVTIAAGLGVVPSDHHTASPAWDDYDGDGDLDLVLAGNGLVDETVDETYEFGPGDPTYLFRNNGDGTFTDASSSLPAEVAGDFTFVAGWIDADHDGDDDLYLVNDFGNTLQPNRLLLNEGGRFTLPADQLGLDVAIEGMGLGIGDLDGDGDEDIAIAGWRQLSIVKDQGFGWFDATQALALEMTRDQVVGWGTEIFDADNDGDMDISQAFGFIDTVHGRNQRPDQPDALFSQNAQGAFVDIAPRIGVDDAASHRSVNPADLNNDGLLDLVKVGLDGKGRIYFSRCSDEAWLTVRFQQPGMNRFGIGTVVTARAGSAVFVRRLRSGGTGFGTGGPMQVHLGLGDLDTVDSLEVLWPDGRVDTFTDVPTRQTLRVERP
ncbi:MAG: CRTAC1 family protein [Alphaproteobacteria bacterium]|nr:CRTAC1 family protein [Alphaproteobacteria bacterium]